MIRKRKKGWIEMNFVERDNLEELNTEELYLLIKGEILPRHIAIIMDGNGRWAEKRGLPRLAGHREGIKSVRDAATLCRELDISALTIYAFSVENWMRPRREVVTLMSLLEQYLQKELNTLMKNEIRFKTIGWIDQLPASVIKWIRKVEDKTEKNDKMILTLALSYSGRAEIVDAINKIIQDYKNGRLKDEKMTELILSGYLYTNFLPEPDLLIRTSGETRLSNFLLWEIAYTELYFTKTLWPDFRRRDMLLAILDYQKRERRFGLIKKQVSGEDMKGSGVAQ